MTTKIIQNLAYKFGLNCFIVKSWLEQGFFSDQYTGEEFFKENIDFIKAKPFVKWVGGKRQLLKQFERFLPEDFYNYFEPFVGGGAMFFNIQREKSFLSDVNEELINAYKVIKNSPHKLVNFLKTLEYSRDCFLEIRAWDREEDRKNKYSRVQRAGRFIYLNRTGFNGLYRVNNQGFFNVPFGRYTNPDFVQEGNILNTSRLLKKTKAEIKLQGFEKVLNKAEKRDFVYFDPPYDVLSDTANFTNYSEGGFGKEGQRKLAEVYKQLDKKGAYVMLSNHDTPLIRELYEGFRFEIVKARRNVNSNSSGRGAINEVVVLNY